MSARIPIGYLLLRRTACQVPENVIGCKCSETKCENADWPCSNGESRCTPKCECEDCDNAYGVTGSDSNTEPGQGGMGRFDLNKLTSSGIETEQHALSLATSVFRAGRLEPEDYNGCKCQSSRCYSGAGEKCPCVRVHLKVRVHGGDNMTGLIGSDSRTEPGQGGTGGVSNVPDETTPPPNTEPEQDDDISSMTWESPQMEEQPAQSRGFDLNELPPSD